jgi:hypothetical protein
MKVLSHRAAKEESVMSIFRSHMNLSQAWYVLKQLTWRRDKRSETVSLCTSSRSTNKYIVPKKQTLRTSRRRLSLCAASPAQASPSTIDGVGCNSLRAPIRALVGIVLLSLLVGIERVIPLLSAGDGDVTRLGFERLRELASLKDFFRCTFKGLG